MIGCTGALQNATCICNFCKVIPHPQFGRLGLAGFLVVLIVGLIVLLTVLFLVIRANKLTIMHIPFSQLHTSAESEVLGEGMYGKVLRGEYRGTQVAVKRMLPPPHSRCAMLCLLCFGHCAALAVSCLLCLACYACLLLCFACFAVLSLL